MFRTVNWRDASLYAVLAVAAVAFALAYVASENAIYFWDYGGYFNRYRDLGERFVSGDWSWVQRLIGGIRNNDYNPSPVALLLPLYALLGGGREVYVAALSGLYLVPAALLAATTAVYVKEGHIRWPALDSGWIIVAALLYWPFWTPTLRGLPDVVGLLPLGAATLLLLRPEQIRLRPLFHGVLIGGLLWLAFVMRRWYAYSCISLLSVAGLAALWRVAVSDKAMRVQELVRTVLFFCACGATLCALLLLQWPLLQRILLTSWSTALEAYQKPFAQHFRLIYGDAGLLLTVLAAVGVTRAVQQRQWRVLFLFSCALVSFLLFSRTQAPEMQHMLPWFFWMFPVVIHGAAWLVGLVRRPQLAWLLPVAMGVCFLAVYVPGARARLAFANVLWPEVRFPLQTQNLDAYRRLADDLFQRLGKEDRFAVFASSEEFTEEMLTAVEPALERSATLIAHVDERDGLLKAPLLARYAIATSPTALQARLPPETQQVVSVLNEAIRSGSGFGEAYQAVAGPYRLAGGIDAWIYERIRPLADAEWVGVRDRFHAIYPGWRETSDGLVPRG